MQKGDIEKFVNDQLSCWPLAAANFRSMEGALVRTVRVNGLDVVVQHNPERIKSALAKVDKESIAARPCFLCVDTRPAEQYHVGFDGKEGRKYRIQINPYPIFPDHLVIVRDAHTPQSILPCYADMLDMAKEMEGFTIFYNGPVSGASAPDHMHFQACPCGLMPLEAAADEALDSVEGNIDLHLLSSLEDAEVYHFSRYARGLFVLRSRSSESMTRLFFRVLNAARTEAGESEPRFNLITWFKDGEFRTLLIMRRQHHSRHYDAIGSDHLTMAPGCADMGGFFIAPKSEDYEKLDSRLLSEMVDDVCISEDAEREMIWKLSRTQRTIRVGIMSAPEIHFEILSAGTGMQKVSYEDGRINYNGVLYDELVFDAAAPSSTFAEPAFVLHDVTIGVNFHWERKQVQEFAGALKFIVEGEKVTAVNIIGLEDYLLSVISSEMNPRADLEFLKAHSIISRSWVLVNLCTHANFDVCADDHCQRYQGAAKAVGGTVRKAIDETWGQVLMYGGEICDARYSKCCGGTMELFSTCWEDRDYPYLQALPDPYCDTHDEAVLHKVLNDFDQETKDFHDWQVRYGRSQLSALIKRRTGMDFGTLVSLEPVEKGPSGRIKYLKVCGTERTEIIGKELNIRRALSESHLKSSAFEVSYEGDDIVLKGRGWGHGVGLCQIGAAVMAHQGHDCTAILQHYYPGSAIDRI